MTSDVFFQLFTRFVLLYVDDVNDVCFLSKQHTRRNSFIVIDNITSLESMLMYSTMILSEL